MSPAAKRCLTLILLAVVSAGCGERSHVDPFPVSARRT
jgi:hypothetical protein